MKVHIQTFGLGQPLVLFHGWGFDSNIWLPIVSTLTKKSYRLYLVDLPGFGETPFMGWEAFKLALLSELPPRFALIGWSMGGLMATRLSAETPDRVTHLMNIASSPRFTQEDNWVGVQPIVLNTFYNQFINDPQQTRVHFIRSQLQGHELPVGIFENPPTLVGLQAGLDMLVNWDLRALLSSIKQPVCYLFGRLDTIIPYRVMLVMKNEYPHITQVVFKKSAHIPFLSHSHEFVELLDEFIS
ncbi:MAG: alpha/beta fold hydrolase [Legionellaceae bacterium]|nr:alpha/beta fold hydrolase [Legionellaceae bacterium]